MRLRAHCRLTVLEVEMQLSQILKSDPLLICEHRAPKGVGMAQQAHDDRAFIAIERIG
jgi:hypothetical protein